MVLKLWSKTKLKEDEFMFYKVLFVLTLYSLYRAGKSFLRESVVFTDGKCSLKSNYSLVAGIVQLMFHVLVLAISLVPTILF